VAPPATGLLAACVVDRLQGQLAARMGPDHWWPRCARRGVAKPLFTSPSKYLGAGGPGAGAGAADEQPIELLALLEAWASQQQASGPLIAALGNRQGGSPLIAAPAATSHAPHVLVRAPALSPSGRDLLVGQPAPPPPPGMHSPSSERAPCPGS
jgi:hypothetical protein